MIITTFFLLTFWTDERVLSWVPSGAGTVYLIISFSTNVPAERIAAAGLPGSFVVFDRATVVLWPTFECFSWGSRVSLYKIAPDSFSKGSLWFNLLQYAGIIFQHMYISINSFIHFIYNEEGSTRWRCFEEGERALAKRETAKKRTREPSFEQECVFEIRNTKNDGPMTWDSKQSNLVG